MHVRALELADIEAYLAHIVVLGQQSGVDGIPHSHPYGKSEPFDMQAAIERERMRWSTPLSTPGWRRAWGIADGESGPAADIVGHLYLEGGALLTGMHRVGLGMGLHRDYHRRGGGSLALRTAIDWARAEPAIAWIDLGVFTENAPAIALYEKFGFERRGVTPDCFRVDGHVIDDIAMSLFVGANLI